MTAVAPCHGTSGSPARFPDDLVIDVPDRRVPTQRIDASRFASVPLPPTSPVAGHVTSHPHRSVKPHSLYRTRWCFALEGFRRELTRAAHGASRAAPAGKFSTLCLRRDARPATVRHIGRLPGGGSSRCKVRAALADRRGKLTFVTAWRQFRGCASPQDLCACALTINPRGNRNGEPPRPRFGLIGGTAAGAPVSGRAAGCVGTGSPIISFLRLLPEDNARAALPMASGGGRKRFRRARSL